VTPFIVHDPELFLSTSSRQNALELFLFLLSYIWPRSSGFPTKIYAHFLSVLPSCMTSNLPTFLAVKSHNYFLCVPSQLVTSSSHASDLYSVGAQFETGLAHRIG